MNRLADAASPYLRQHADNPVDWYEWGPDAFAAARERDLPIFLSVGYAACHWCHVMAHESFDDATVAHRLNADFVPVKVDREERPDVDAVYMTAVQALTGRGGWPMSVFLLPDGRPFFGGTYWPRDDRAGMPGFLRVLASVTDLWRNQRDRVEDAGRTLLGHLTSVTVTPAGQADITDELTRDAAASLVRAWDRHEGGFGSAPKFPQAMVLDFLLAHGRRTGDTDSLDAAASSLIAMSRGGIYDHVGGGFARYATDRRWRVPHFEKMLYDNALLLRTYAHAAKVTGEPRCTRVAAETAAWLRDDLMLDGGGFACALDADSEGQEGRYYVWDRDEFADAVRAADADPQSWFTRWGVTVHGNVDDPHGHMPDGTSILREDTLLPEDDELLAERARVRAQLLARRRTRVPPETDTKVLVSWNALAIGALAQAGALLDRPEWIAWADRAASFIRDTMINEHGQLWHRWAEGHGAGIPAFAEDVAFLARALLDLYEAGHDPAWFDLAVDLAADADARFRDDDGTYFTTAVDGEALVTRPREVLDNAVPSATSVMADVHLRLAGLTGDLGHLEAAEVTLSTLSEAASRHPLAFGGLLGAIERYLAGSTEVAVVGEPSPHRDALVATYWSQWRPGAVVAVGGAGDAESVPLLRDRPMRDRMPTAYVCEQFVCAQPVTDPDALHAQLGDGDHADGDRRYAQVGDTDGGAAAG